MVTSQERLKILQMLQEGKITPKSAAQLLDAMGAGASAAKQAPRQEPLSGAARAYAVPEPVPTSGSKAHWLRVRVTDTDSGRPRVNVRIPVGLVNLGLKLGARYTPEIEGLDIGALLQAAQTGETGPFVDVYDEDEGEHVEVFLE